MITKPATGLVEALHEICRFAALDPTDARLIRNVNNAVFELAAHPVVVRLVTLPSYVARAEVAVTAATVFADHGAPTIRLLPGLGRQPIRVGDHVATLWERVPQAGPAPGGADLAAILRAIHAVEVPAGRLPRWDPLGDLRNRFLDARALPTADLTFLLGRVDELTDAVADLEFALPTRVVHGDAHLGNVIPGPGGPVICDFDSCCIGPPEWDLTPMAVSAVRLGRSKVQQRALTAHYGFDVTAWDGFGVLRDIRDLKLLAGVLPGGGRGRPAEAEYRRRMGSLRSGRRDDRWAALR